MTVTRISVIGMRPFCAFAKELTRSVRGSVGRFLAIAGIVALGCGFFAGLSMAGLDMRLAADALYDGRLDERISFIQRACSAITDGWADGDVAALAERARRFSDTVEYDDEALEQRIGQGNGC